MRVKCIIKTDDLTTNKIYDVLAYTDKIYRIMNDYNYICDYEMSIFEEERLMTVKELKIWLEDFDENMEVKYYSEGCQFSVNRVRIVDEEYEDNKKIVLLD